MKYVLDEQGLALKKRHIAWWQREERLYTRSTGTPLGDLWLPLADGSLAHEDMDLSPSMVDVERLVGAVVEPGTLGMFGDHFVTTAPYTRIPWMEAIMGAPIRATIQGGSMRAHHVIEKWEDWDFDTDHINQEWLDLLLRFTNLLVLRSGGRAAVAQTLMRGPSDLAEALLGPEFMVFSMVDHPQALRAFLETVTEAFISVLHAQLALIPQVDGGYVNPFGIWSPGTVVRTQCDASAFLSRHHYAEWYLPYDVQISESVDFSIIHLHSSSLHTVDAILEYKHPDAIQVTFETAANGPSLEVLVPIFNKILARKPLIFEGPLTEQDVTYLFDTCPNGGFCINARDAGW
jgi:hypothetical protein